MPEQEGDVSSWWQRLLLRAAAFFLRRLPTHPGRWRLELWAVRRAPWLMTRAKPAVVRLRKGGRLRVDGSSQTGRVVYVTGDYEPGTTQLIRQILRPSDVMIDVGANIGFFTVVGARAVGTHGRVIAFEPVASVRRKLEENVHLNMLGNVEIRSEAVGARSGEVELFTGPMNNTGLASIRPLHGSPRVIVAQVRLDDVLGASTAVRLVKIDVEGAELDVLRGFERRLQTDRPDLIVEVTDDFLRALNASAHDLLRHLDRRGYRLSLVHYDGRLQPIDVASVAASRTQFNMYCTQA